MTAEVIYALFGSCIGVGLLVGSCVALFNSWTP